MENLGHPILPSYIFLSPYVISWPSIVSSSIILEPHQLIASQVQTLMGFKNMIRAVELVIK